MMPDDNRSRAPAHSIEAECTVLGAVMLDNNAFDHVGDKLVERDFYVDHNRRIWSAMTALLKAGKPADAVTVAAELESRGELDLIGGLRALAAIVDQVPSARNVVYYADIVRDRSYMRQIGETSVHLADLARCTSRKPADLLAEAESLLAALADAQGVPDAKPIGEHLSETVNAIEQRMERGGDIQGLPTNLTDIDAKLNGLQNGDLVLVAARTSIGKTALGMQFAQSAALDGKSVHVFSLEMSVEMLTERTLSNLARVNLAALRSGKLSRDEWGQLSAAMGRLKPAKLFIDAATPMTVTQMRARARRTQRKAGLDLIVIDYVGLIDGERGEKRHEEVSDISRRLKGMARELNVPIVALVQLNRKAEDRTNNRPKLSDLRDSGALEQDADVVLLLYRDDYYNPDSDWKGTAEITIAKQRMGETGMVRVAFRGEFSRFDDLSPEYERPAPSMGPKNLRARRGMDK